MTDHSDLIEQIQAAAEITGDELLQAAASGLSSQSLSLSEAREEIDRLRALNAANGEFRKSTKGLVAVSQPLIAQLDERLGLATGELDTLRKAYIEAREAEKAAERQRDEALDAAKTMDEAQAAWFSRAWVAEEALKQFVAHYPMGVNPFLDDAFRCARSALENVPAGLADANTNPPLSDLSSLRKGAEAVEAVARVIDPEGFRLWAEGKNLTAGQAVTYRDAFAKAHLALNALSALVSGSREDGA